MDTLLFTAITSLRGTEGVSRRALAQVLGGGAVAGLVTLPGFGRAVAARQGVERDHPVIVALSAVLQDAAAMMDMPVTEIAVQRLEAMDWPDACLGLATEGEVCAEVITPGYRVVIGPPGDGVVYRTDQHGTIQREPAGDEQEMLHVRYEVTGGVAGIHDVFEIDVADLPDDEATVLRRLIAEADVWRLPAQLDDGVGIDDGFAYHLTVSAESRQHTVSLINTLGPADSHYPRVWDLLRWLDARMKTSQTGAAQTTPTAGHDTLRVHYELYGGHAGERVVLELSTADLDEDAGELRRLVEEADFWDLPEEIGEYLIDDGYDYTVTVSDGRRRHTVKTYDGNEESQARYPGFRELLLWLHARIQEE